MSSLEKGIHLRLDRKKGSLKKRVSRYGITFIYIVLVMVSSCSKAFLVRSHICWRMEQNIFFYKIMETSL